MITYEDRRRVHVRSPLADAQGRDSPAAEGTDRPREMHADRGSETATGTGRLITLMRWAGRFPSVKPGDYVFPWCENRQIDPTRPTKGWRTAWSTSDMTIMAIAGHVSKHMLEHYSRIRVEAKRAALDAIAKPVFGGVCTKTCTKSKTGIRRFS